MLRIDESSNTLVAPQQGGLEPDAPLERTDLLSLVCAGWTPFAHELGQKHLHLLAVEPHPGVDLLGFDDASGHVAVMLAVGQQDAASVLGRALVAAGAVASWDAQRLAGIHEALEAAVPGDSPRVMLFGGPFDSDLIAALDWLTRRHGIEFSAHEVHVMRFGSERLLNVSRAYPTTPGERPSATQPFFADVMTAAPADVAADEGASAPPPPPATIERVIDDF